MPHGPGLYQVSHFINMLQAEAKEVLQCQCFSAWNPSASEMNKPRLAFGGVTHSCDASQPQTTSRSRAAWKTPASCWPQASPYCWPTESWPMRHTDFSTNSSDSWLCSQNSRWGKINKMFINLIPPTLSQRYAMHNTLSLFPEVDMPRNWLVRWHLLRFHLLSREAQFFHRRYTYRGFAKV